MPVSNDAVSVSRLFSNNAPDVGQHSGPLVILFLAFQIFGLFGALVTVFSALYSSVTRHPTWYTFLISWIISTISYSLLLFGGNINRPNPPPFDLCIVQSSLIYAAPPLSAAAMLGMVVQIWFNVHAMIFNTPVKAQSIFSKVILALPYVLFFGIFGEALAFGLSQPTSVRVTGSGMYCNTGIPIPGRISAGIVAVVLFPAVIIEIIMVVLLRKNWAAFRRRRNTFSMIVRILLFSLFGIFALGCLSLFFFFTIHHGASLNIVIALIPAVAVLIFGTQKDLLEIWIFWKRCNGRRGKEPESSHTQSDAPPRTNAIPWPASRDSNSTFGSPVLIYGEKDLPALPETNESMDGHERFDGSLDGHGQYRREYGR